MLPWSEGETPILSRLVAQAARTAFPLHVPGHQQGRVLPLAFGAWLGAAAALDLTELPGLDDFHNPTGCISDSEARAAAHYGSRACFYSVNGSTTGVMAALAGCVPAGGSVLFLNPFHVSAWRGLVYADARPLLPAAWFRADAPVATVDWRDVRRVLEAYRSDPGIAAVYVTSPTYRGEAAPIRAIARMVHDAGLALIVDEAHGAHFGLHPEWPEHSVAAGADIVVQSVHKTLPGLTQTAWVHVNGDRVEPARVADALRDLHTTSPSWLLLASLDVAQAWLRMEGADAARRATRVLSPLFATRRAGAERRQDPLRHWVSAPALADSRRLYARLADAGLFAEYADADGVLSIFGFGATDSVVRRYQEIVAAWQATLGAVPQGTTAKRPWRDEPDRGEPDRGESDWVGADRGDPDLSLLAFAASPRQVRSAAVEWVPITESRGRVCAQPVTPYPPGVPVVWPGQVLEQAAVERLLALSRESGERRDIHGLRQGRCVAVIDRS